MGVFYSYFAGGILWLGDNRMALATSVMGSIPGIAQYLAFRKNRRSVLLCNFFEETEQEMSPPESSSSIPASLVTRETPESSNQYQHEAVQSVPSPPQPDEASQVDKINLIVKCAGKSRTIDVFPLERISVILKEACEHAVKKPEKMILICNGNILDVNKTVSQYELRGGTTVNLIPTC